MSYYGSESYWYLIADANGLSGTEELPEGRTLVIPNAIANSVNNAETFKVYNEQEIIGSTSPEVRTLKKKKKWYQKLVQIIVIVIAIVAAVFTAGAALGLMGVAASTIGASLGAIGAAGAAFAGTVAATVGVTAGALSLATVALAAGIGAVAYAAANIVSQGLMIASGLQTKFEWRQVSKAAGSGAISGALTATGAGLAKSVAEINAANNVATAANGLTTTQQILIKGGVEVVKQFAQNGKITNYAGIVGAAMGVNGTTAAGLSIAEGAARGRGSNAMDWVNLASSAILGGERTGVANGELNWKYVAVQALGTLVVGGLMGEDAALAYAGQAIGDGITGADYEKQRELELQARENAREDAMARAMGIPTESDPEPGLALRGGTVGNAFGNALGNSLADTLSQPQPLGSGVKVRSDIWGGTNSYGDYSPADLSLTANGIPKLPMQMGDFSGSGNWTFVDQYPQTSGGQWFSPGANGDSVNRNDEMARIMQQVNEPQYALGWDSDKLRIETRGVGSMTSPETEMQLLSDSTGGKSSISYDEMGNVIGMGEASSNGGSIMSYGDQMKNVGDFVGTFGKNFGLGVAQGGIGLVSDSVKGWAMIGDMVVNGGNNIDRIDQFNLRPFQYDAGVGQVAGGLGEMLSPGAYGKAVELGGTGLRALGPTADAMMYNYLQRTGGVLSAAPDISGANRLFSNQLPEKLAAELAEARSVGVKPLRFGDQTFDATINQGTVKYVVTESGELLFTPHTVNNVEISHAVLSNGRPVLAAGQADIAGASGQYVGLGITPHSGHFLNGATSGQSAAALEVAKAAFQKIGIKF
jgi:hypothetical protein